MSSEKEKQRQKKLKEIGDARRAAGKANKAKNEKNKTKQMQNDRDKKGSNFIEEFPADFGVTKK